MISCEQLKSDEPFQAKIAKFSSLRGIHESRNRHENSVQSCDLEALPELWDSIIEDSKIFRMVEKIFMRLPSMIECYNLDL